MNSLALLVATASLSVQYGWQQTRDGQVEYIIQIEPTLVQSFIDGQEISSTLPPEVRSVRRFRIRVGNDPLPKDNIRPASAEMTAPRLPIGDDPLPDRRAPAKSAADASSPARPFTRYGDEPNLVDPATGRPLIDTADGRREQTAAERAASLKNQEEARRAREERAANAASASDAQSKAEEVGSEETAAAPNTSHTNKKSEGASWGWLTASIAALCASLGVNVYQGWNLASARQRYFQLVDRLSLRSAFGGTSLVGTSGSTSDLASDGITIEHQ